MNELDYYKTAVAGLSVFLNRMMTKRDPLDVPWSEIEHHIDEWIHSSIDRDMLKAKLHDDDITFDQLSERHNMTVQNTKKRYYRAKRRLYSKIDLS